MTASPVQTSLDRAVAGDAAVDASRDAGRAVADCWFDPICPWAWMTSRWMLEVTKVRPVDVRWHVMSLAVLNEGKDVPEEYREALAAAWGPVRLMTAVQQAHGQDAVAALYTALGIKVHHEKAPLERATYAAALADAGLPAALVDAADDASYDAEVRRTHGEGIGLVGEEVGTPVVAVEGVAFFGPVVSPAPKGEAAGRLWDGVRLVAGTDGFFELKRSRDRDPVFD